VVDGTKHLYVYNSFYGFCGASDSSIFHVYSGSMEVMTKTRKEIKDSKWYFAFPFRLAVAFIVVFGIIYVMPTIVNTITKIYEELL